MNLRKINIAILISIAALWGVFAGLNFVPTTPTVQKYDNAKYRPSTVAENTEATLQKNKHNNTLGITFSNTELVNNITINVEQGVSDSTFKRYKFLVENLSGLIYENNIRYINIVSKPLNTFLSASLEDYCFYDTTSCTIYIYSDNYSANSFYYAVASALDRNYIYSSSDYIKYLALAYKDKISPQTANEEFFRQSVVLYYTEYNTLSKYPELLKYISAITQKEA